MSDHLATHPKADPSKDPDRSAIEAAFISWAEKGWPDRSASIAGKTNDTPSSFEE
jgi:hypothetical protein